MAKELLVSTTSGNTIYAIGRVPIGKNIGQWGNVVTDALEDYAGANFANYAIPMTELGASGFFEADMPVVFFTERSVEIIFYQQAGADPVEGDTKLSASRFDLIDDYVSVAALSV